MQLTKQQEYLLNRMPKAQDLDRRDVKEPKYVVAARRVIEKWEEERGRAGDYVGKVMAERENPDLMLRRHSGYPTCVMCELPTVLIQGEICDACRIVIRKWNSANAPPSPKMVKDACHKIATCTTRRTK